MTKLFLALVLAVASLSGPAFATDFELLDKSLGIGIRASPYFETLKLSLEPDESKSRYSTTLYEAFAYFDATYVQVSLGFAWASANSSTKTVDDLSVLGGDEDSVSPENDSRSYLSLGFLLRYPFDMEGFSIFPVLGLEYDLNLAYEDRDGQSPGNKEDMSDDDKSDLNMLWLKAGFGMDIPISSKLYLRPEVLFAYKLRSKLERDSIEEWEAEGMESASFTTIKAELGIMIAYRL